jgi:ATP-binding cassette subfamily B (MDR/TAP) protein 1
VLFYCNLQKQIRFGYTIELLYKPVMGCDVPGLPTCESIAEDMQNMSFNISYGWLAVMCSTIVGNVLLWYGFGMASERMNKRVRDAAFGSLVRQEVAFFDKRSVGSITSQLQDDAAMIHAFSGEPIRTFVVSLASLLVGLIISFFFMWPFALLVLAIFPFMAFGAKMRMKTFMGEDEGVESDDDKNSPGGIVVETLLNMRTVASLTIEEMRSKEYSEALRREDPSPVKTNLVNGLAIGLGQLFQQWGMALMFFWGGWLLFTYPGIWSYRDFLISMFSLLVSISGMTTGTQGSTDKEKAKKAAGRIFRLIDRDSAIDPLSDTGMKTG